MMRLSALTKENAVVYDLLLLGFYIFFEPRLGSYITSISGDGIATPADQRSLGLLFLSAAAAQAIGTVLRRKSTIAYLQQTNHKTGAMGFVGAIFLIVMHLTLFGFMMTFDGVKYLAGESYENTWGKFPLIILPFIAAFLPTGLIIAASFPGTKPVAFPETKKDTALDITGSLLILYSACVVTTAFWQVLVEAGGESLHTENVLANVLIALLLFAAFLLMYLPGRYMFLIRDYHYRSTWIRILLVYLPLGYVILTGRNL